MATLTSVNGVNATLRKASPSSFLAVQENYGRVRHAYDSYVIDAADEFGTSGLVDLMLIPKGARLIDAHLVMPDAGGAGIFDVGWAASEETSGGTAIEVADADGIFVGADPGAAAVDARMAGTVAGWNKTFAAEVQVQLDCTEATTDSGGDTFELSILYVVD